MDPGRLQLAKVKYRKNTRISQIPEKNEVCPLVMHPLQFSGVFSVRRTILSAVMKKYLMIFLLAGGWGLTATGFAQNKFILKKEVSETKPDSMFSVFVPAPNTGAQCINLDSIRREISGNREVYLYWRRTREQAWYLVDIDENGVASRFRPDGPATDMHGWMQQYLGKMSFRPAWSATGNQTAQPIDSGSLTPNNVRSTRKSILRFALPGFNWPRFQQDYYLASLVETRCRSEKPGECVEGYVRLRVLVDAKGKPLTHEVLAGENDFLNRVVGEELNKVGFKPSDASATSDPATSGLPPTVWAYLDFEFSTRSCR
jgi:hypothetical protein